MSILNEVLMGDCSEVYHYFLNTLRYLRRNPNDNKEKENIRKDLNDSRNSEQITLCVLSHQRIMELNSEIAKYLRQ